MLWSAPPVNLNLAANEIHLWRANLDLRKVQPTQIAATLSPDEQERGARFYREQDRKRFLVGRYLLRKLLASYLKLEAKELRFNYNPYGKPILANKDPIHFNLSHSQNLAIYAISLTHQIGVDLELVRALNDIKQIAQRFFSAREYAKLNSLPQQQQLECFFRFWTCKEAYLKGIGEGIGGLEGVEIELREGELPILTKVTGWSLFQFIPDTDYIGALAVAGKSWRVRCWDLQPEINL